MPHSGDMLKSLPYVFTLHIEPLAETTTIDRAALHNVP